MMGGMKAIEGTVALTDNEVRLLRAITKEEAISARPEPQVEVAIMREGGDRYVRIQRGSDYIEIHTAKEQSNA